MVGLASDHAGFELKQYVKETLKPRELNIKIMVRIRQTVATILILHMRWPVA